MMDPRELSLSNSVIRYRVRLMSQDEVTVIGQHLYAHGLRDKRMPDDQRYQSTGLATRCLWAAAVVVVEINGAPTGAMLIEARPEDRAQWVIAYDTTPTYAGDVMHGEVVDYARDMARRAGATLVRRVETVTFEPA